MVIGHTGESHTCFFRTIMFGRSIPIDLCDQDQAVVKRSKKTVTHGLKAKQWLNLAGKKRKNKKPIV
jgi:hypothetical protein